MKLLISAILSLIAFNASAADINTCLDRVALNGCVPNYHEAVEMAYADSCKVVSNSKVAFLSSNQTRIFSVDTKACEVSAYTFKSGQVVDSAVYGGMMFLVLDSNRVIVLDKENSVRELLTTAGKPYTAATGVELLYDYYGRQVGVRLLIKGRGPVELTAEKIQARLDKNQTDLLALSWKNGAANF